MIRELNELNFPQTKILKISNGIELSKYTNLNKNSHEGVNYGFVGRLSQFKNLNYMLMEFKSYSELFPSDILLIYGEGSELHHINAFIEQYNLSNNVKLLGFEQDKAKIYNNIDVLIDPSYGQGISNANLEAMSTNTLVIASNVDGNTDLINDGKTGLLFEPRKKGALIKKMIYYKNSPREVKHMVENARKMISEKYNIKSIPPQIIDFVLNRK
jgi:glycosyltransferase involved in cell wall biosynthesis